jgi:hypothetical protein
MGRPGGPRPGVIVSSGKLHPELRESSGRAPIKIGAVPAVGTQSTGRQPSSEPRPAAQPRVAAQPRPENDPLGLWSRDRNAKWVIHGGINKGTTKVTRHADVAQPTPLKGLSQREKMNRLEAYDEGGR